MKNYSRGFVPIVIVLIVIVALVAIGGGVYYFRQNTQPVPQTQSETKTNADSKTEADKELEASIKELEEYCPEETQTTMCLSSYAYELYHRADVRLNKIYNRILNTIDSKIKEEEKLGSKYEFSINNFQRFKEDIISAEKVWIQYRDAMCKAETGYDTISGTIAQIEYPGCLKIYTDEQIIKLEQIEEFWLQ
jgi:uncharacterized protein YecT (DUF1311 family)